MRRPVVSLLASAGLLLALAFDAFLFGIIVQCQDSQFERSILGKQRHALADVADERYKPKRVKILRDVSLLKQHPTFTHSSIQKLDLSGTVFLYAGNLEGYEAHGGWVSSAVDLVRFAAAFDDLLAGIAAKRAGAIAA